MRFRLLFGPASAALLLAAGCTASREAITRSSHPTADGQTVAASAPRHREPLAGEMRGQNRSTQPPGPEFPTIPAQVIQTSASDESIPAPPPAPLDDIPKISASLVPDGSVWTLSSLEQLAVEHNPALQQASASAHKAMGYRNQVARKPNPTVGYNATQLADQGTDQHVAFVEQDIVLGHKLSRNRTVLDREVQSLQWEIEVQRFRVLTDVRQRYYEALAAQRRVELTLEFNNVAQKGVEFAKARLQAKEGALPEVLQSEIQLQQVDLQRQRAEAAYRGAWKQLMAVAGQSETSPGVLAGALPHSAETHEWDALAASVLAASPELQAAQARIARARANVDRQQVQAVPNLSLMVAAGHDYGTDSGMVNAQVGLPVPIFNRNEGNISAACAELNRATHEARRVEQAIRARLAQAVQEYEAALASVELYDREILPRAAQTLKLTEEAHAAGEFGFLEVLVARRTYFDANLEFVAAQSELAKAQAALDGMVLTGGLDQPRDTEFDSALRDQALSGQ